MKKVMLIALAVLLVATTAYAGTRAIVSGGQVIFVDGNNKIVINAPASLPSGTTYVTLPSTSGTMARTASITTSDLIANAVRAGDAYINSVTLGIAVNTVSNTITLPSGATFLGAFAYNSPGNAAGWINGIQISGSTLRVVMNGAIPTKAKRIRVIMLMP